MGLIAAFLVAVYPNLWMSDELGLSEALSPVLVALVLWAAYRFWRKPGLGSVVALAASVGLATLARDELSLLMVFVVVPMVLMASVLRWRRRIGLLAVAGLTVLVMVGPWVGLQHEPLRRPGLHQLRFRRHPGLFQLSRALPRALRGLLVARSARCWPRTRFTPGADESVQGAEAQAYAFRFIDAHRNRILPVEMARLGRAFGVFHPLEQIRLDSTVETRPYRWALVGPRDVLRPGRPVGRRPDHPAPSTGAHPPACWPWASMWRYRWP